MILTKDDLQAMADPDHHRECSCGIPDGDHKHFRIRPTDGGNWAVDTYTVWRGSTGIWWSSVGHVYRPTRDAALRQVARVEGRTDRHGTPIVSRRIGGHWE